MPTTTERGRMARKNWIIAGALVSMAIYMALLRLSPSAHGAFYFLAVLAAFVACGLSFLWMRSIDELAISAHVQSWFWGGMLGLLALLAMLFAIAPNLTAIVEAVLTIWRGHATPTGGFLLGILLPMSLQALGYAVWWTAFWLRRR